MPAPLCLDLYNLLERKFGEVRIGAAGEPVHYAGARVNLRAGGVVRIGRPRPTLENASRTVLEPSSWGESYRCRCPFCGDSRFRLWIGHRWGEYPHMAWCFNEPCLASEERRLQLRLMIFHTRGRIRLRAAPGRPETGVLARVESPGMINSLQDLPENHPAWQYVAQRGYDPDEIGQCYGVGFCDSVNDMAHRRLQGRIYIPLQMRGDLVGWQGRFLGDRDWTEVPKYYGMPGMAKRLILYNLDEAMGFDDVAVVEGCTDVWRSGPFAVGLLQKRITFSQRLRLLAGWKDRGALLMILDADAQLENEAYAREFRTYFKNGVVQVVLPDGTDPGSLDASALHEIMRGAADLQRVRLSAKTLAAMGVG